VVVLPSSTRLERKKVDYSSTYDGFLRTRKLSLPKPQWYASNDPFIRSKSMDSTRHDEIKRLLEEVFVKCGAVVEQRKERMALRLPHMRVPPPDSDADSEDEPEMAACVFLFPVILLTEWRVVDAGNDFDYHAEGVVGAVCVRAESLSMTYYTFNTREQILDAMETDGPFFQEVDRRKNAHSRTYLWLQDFVKKLVDMLAGAVPSSPISVDD
jgi:hypothetical protein